MSTSLAQLPADIERLRLEGCSLVLIDTPPAINMAIQRVINVAELVVIPTRPSPHDLRAVAGTVDMVERAHCRMVFVLNAVNLRAKITSDAVIALSQHGTVAPVFSRNALTRASFARSRSKRSPPSSDEGERRREGDGGRQQRAADAVGGVARRRRPC